MGVMTPDERPPLSEALAERGIRDLMSLLALPALWNGRDANTILQIMIEAVERIVPLRMSYTRVAALPNQPPIEILRIGNRTPSEAVAATWHAAIKTWPDSREVDARVVTATAPMGDLRAVRFSMGYGQQPGYIWFASDQAGFPLPTQLAFLRAAVSLAMTGLQTARANYERERASRAKDEFLAMLGHEMRNPLAPIVTALELLKLKHRDAAGREFNIIQRQVGHLERLVDDLLDVSRITQGKVELKKEVVSVHAVLRRALESVEPLMTEKRHTVIADLEDDDPQILGDGMRLHQIFANLLTNAAKYTDPEGTIWVTTRVVGERIVIAIRDNGTGIDATLLPRLFQMFEQGASTIDRAKGGLGIGLAIVKSFVTLHGGTIDVGSEGPGKGATFNVRLPLLMHSLAGNAQVAPDHAPSAATPAAKSRILVVDDNRDALETIKTYLEVAGQLDVCATGSSLEALARAAEFKPEVAVLDIGLPEMDGCQLAGELRRRHPGLSLIALSGYGQQRDFELTQNAGFDHHLIKPVDMKRLMDTIASCIASGKSKMQ